MPRLFRGAYEIARIGGLGLTAHAGEDAPPDYVWQAIDVLGATRVGHGCSAVQDAELLRRLARDRVVVECCISSNYHTGAVPRGAPHPIVRFLDAGVPVAVCCDNTTVSRTDQIRENLTAAEHIGFDAIETIHREAEQHTFIRPERRLDEDAALDPAGRAR
jgi:adenosine deaminase